MIIDAYVSTLTSNSIDVRIIADSPKNIDIVIPPEIETSIPPRIHAHNLYFFSYTYSELEADRQYKARLFQDKEGRLEIHFHTLALPPGPKICRFGILPDLHISHNHIHRPDSGKRLYGKALELAHTYIQRIEKHEADFIIFPGDTLDPASEENMELFSRLRNRSNIPFYPVIGNHESWGNGDGRQFNSMFCTGEHGYYAFSRGNTRFILLSTPDQSALDQHTEQFSWLLQELDTYGQRMNILLFLHFSFILHPCVRGFKNDGMQQIYNAKELLRLFKRYKGIKVVFAGHKNVPSRVSLDGIEHILSPQLIQAPCGYDIVDLYEHGLMRTVYEIDEQDYVWQSRRAYGSGWGERFGTEKTRNFTLVFS